MSREGGEVWVVEVRRAQAVGYRPGDWCCISKCGDVETAIAVADGLHNFMSAGLIGGGFHIRTRPVERKVG